MDLAITDVIVAAKEAVTQAVIQYAMHVMAV